jgi:Fe-S oxidoreductase
LPYGHFGDGCIHVRLDLPLDHAPELFRQFVFDAAHLVVRHGGSCSGEHGDGRARGELLPVMYSPQVIELFGAVKALLDPDDLLNPGILVRPRPLDADLRRPRAKAIPAGSGFSFADDDGDFTKAVHRCVGVGKCRADTSAAGGFMCPSYLASKDEKDVTRGRARVLQELTIGALVPNFASREVHDSLDLCLSCKACASDCPAGVDMAQYKSEVLHRTYQGRLRPISHYSLGWLPRWLWVLDRLPRLAPAMINYLMAIRPLARVLLRAGGMDPRRGVPAIATIGFTRAWRREAHGRRASGGDEVARERTVVLWADSFTDGLTPEVAHAAAAVLHRAGYRVVVPERKVCCGLTWITTGQLTAARRKLLRLLDVLGPYAAQGIPIIGLEPSCTAVLRSDLRDLLPEDPRAAAVAAATKTLAELLTGTSGWHPPDLSSVEVLVQPHCHQHAVMGFASDREVLDRSGAKVNVLAGCCGLAGNFGMEAGHYEMSVAVAENSLLPALRRRSDSSIVLADGFSCRVQSHQLAGVTPIHLAQLLALHLPADRPVD